MASGRPPIAAAPFRAPETRPVEKIVRAFAAMPSPGRRQIVTASTSTTAEIAASTAGVHCHLRFESVERFSGDIGRVRDELDTIAHADEVFVISPTEAEVERTRQLVFDLGLTDRVRFVRPQPHHILASYYRAADVVLVPSRSESVGHGSEGNAEGGATPPVMRAGRTAAMSIELKPAVRNVTD